MTEEQHRAIMALARERQVSMADILREAIREKLLAAKPKLVATAV
ncbi:MAG TPA: ribbon-helix-helix protein, CopG family [Chloroflexota bacterium]|nr:ribbon-helix-helix protein, CopG family [Chloroflexota bacterium]